MRYVISKGGNIMTILKVEKRECTVGKNKTVCMRWFINIYYDASCERAVFQGDVGFPDVMKGVAIKTADRYARTVFKNAKVVVMS